MQCRQRKIAPWLPRRLATYSTVAAAKQDALRAVGVRASRG